jgi:acetyl esterase
VSRFEHLRRRLGARVAQGFFEGASRLGSLHPKARPEAHGLEVIRDVSYDPTHPIRRLDIWRPRGTSPDAPLPALLYVHGGGFRILSKETHWVMALAFARRGFVVFNIEYRLAPTHPFPAAVEDAAAAYAWVVAHAAEYGGDVARLVLAGESAGANLVAALTVAACYERPEAFARQVFETGVAPQVVLPACGIHQVSDPGRFKRRKPKIARFIADRIDEVSHGYLGARDGTDPSIDLADPLRVFERDDAPARPLPRVFLTCGTADPILDDTRRLHAALVRRGATAEVRYYPGEPHAFHALVFRASARRHWDDTWDFLARHL